MAQFPQQAFFFLGVRTDSSTRRLSPVVFRTTAFDAGKEVEAIKDWVEPVGDGAVAAVFGVGVVSGMSAGALQDFRFLEEGDHFAVFTRRAVGPAVDLVGDGTDDGGQNPSPVEPAKEGDDGKESAGHDAGGEVTFPEVGLGEIARFEVMADVGFDDPLAKKGPFSIAVGVFQPMDDSRDEIDRDKDGDGLYDNEPDFE